MNQKIQDLMYHSGLTAQGCWDEMDEYDKQGIHKFAQLIIQECLAQVDEVGDMFKDGSEKLAVTLVEYAIKKHFGVKND